MRIDAGSSFYQTGIVASSCTPAGTSDIATSSNEGPTPSSGVSKLDFTSMTLQQLSDWMNDQVRSGAMSLHDSSSFVGLTLKMDVRTGQMTDMASDTAPVNFMARVSDGITGALSRGDQDGAARLQAALDTMRRSQGQISGVDIRA